MESTATVAVAAQTVYPARQDFPNMLHVPESRQGFFALLGHDREPDLAFLDIEDLISPIPFRIENLPLGGRQHGFSVVDYGKKNIESNRGSRLRAISHPPFPERLSLHTVRIG